MFYPSSRYRRRLGSSQMIIISIQCLIYFGMLAAFFAEAQPIGVAICAPAIVGLLVPYCMALYYSSHAQLEITEYELRWYNGLGRTIRIPRSAVGSLRWVDRFVGSQGRSRSVLQVLDHQGQNLFLMSTANWDFSDLRDVRDLLCVHTEEVESARWLGRIHRPGNVRWTLIYTSLIVILMAAAASSALLVHHHSSGISINPEPGYGFPTDIST